MAMSAPESVFLWPLRCALAHANRGPANRVAPIDWRLG